MAGSKVALKIAAHHPREKLLFFIGQEFAPSDRTIMGDFIASMEESRRWLNGPPRYVDEVEDGAATAPDDPPPELLGGYIELYSALNLSREADVRQFKDVEALLHYVSAFSRQHGLVIAFEFNGESVGAIENGQMDKSLAVGLIGEWRTMLGI